MSRTPICKVKWGREDCDAFELGYLVKQLRNFQLWPGNPNDIILYLNSKSILDVHADIVSMHNFMRPEKYLSAAVTMVHVRCGCTSDLVARSKAAVDTSGMSSIPEPENTHLQVQRQKLDTSRIEVSKFKRHGAPKGL